jgi:hypothetical protein
MMIDPGNDRAGKGRAIPLGLLGMLCLVALVESSIAGHALDFTRFYIHDWAFTGRAARTSVKDCGILCFGDSLVKFGVVPRVLEARLDRRGRSYNLAVCNGQAASSYFLLRRALKAGARPSALVVDFAPHLLAAGPGHNLRQWPELMSLGEWLDLGWAARHGAFFAQVSLAGLLPSVKDRDEIRGNIRAALRGESGSHRGEIPAYVAHWRRNRGANIYPQRPSYRGAIDATNPAYFPRAWRCHPVNEAYLRRFLALADAGAIPVFWLLPPTAPQFQARRDALGLETGQEAFLHRLQHDFANLTIVDGRHAGYDIGLFIDQLHLGRQGAAALSAGLAEVLSLHLDLDRPSASPRRVPLPPFDPRATAIRVEDPGPALVARKP